MVLPHFENFFEDGVCVPNTEEFRCRGADRVVEIQLLFRSLQTELATSEERYQPLVIWNNILKTILGTVIYFLWNKILEIWR